LHSISGFEDNSKKEMKIFQKPRKSKRKIWFRSKSKPQTERQLEKKRIFKQANSDLDYLDWWSKYFLSVNNQVLKRAKRLKKNDSDSSSELSSEFQEIRSSNSVDDNAHSSSETKYSKRKKMSITKKSKLGFYTFQRRCSVFFI
jgi:hypothetical protein